MALTYSCLTIDFIITGIFNTRLYKTLMEYNRLPTFSRIFNFGFVRFDIKLKYIITYIVMTQLHHCSDTFDTLYKPKL